MDWLKEMMNTEGETNRSSFIGQMIATRYNGGVTEVVKIAKKRPVGRPKKVQEEIISTETDEPLYPAPYDKKVSLTRAEWEGYYIYRGEDVPALPMPVIIEN